MRHPYRLIPAVSAFLLACASLPHDQTVVLIYDDFGPQAMAYPLLGARELPWEPPSQPLLGEDPILVVVYRDLDLATVKHMYPSSPAEQLEYRYVSHDDALRYLDTRIERNLLVNLTDRLRTTRRKIQQALEPR